MFVTYLLFILVQFNPFLGISSQAIPNNWVDPYDMSPSNDYLKYSDEKDNAYTQKDTETDVNILYLKRFVNMVLNLVDDTEVYSGHLFFKIDPEKYEFLQNFQMGTETNLDKLDKILGEIFQKPRHEFLQKYLENTFHKCLTILLSREGILSIVLFCYAFVLFQLFKAHFSYFKIFQFLLFNFFVFDIIFTWIHLYQKFAAESMAKSLKFTEIPIECLPNEMTSLQFFVNLFKTKDKCKEYFEYKYEDIFYKITPGLVLSEIFARSIQYPAQKIGQGFGQLCHGIYSIFPFPLNIILLPILLLFFCLLTCIILSTILGKTIKLNLFHLISFSFGESSNNGDQISGRNLERLLKINEHRQFVEIVDNRDEKEEKIETRRELKQIKGKTNETPEKTNDNREEKDIETRKLKKIEGKTKETQEINETQDETNEENEIKNASGDHN